MSFTLSDWYNASSTNVFYMPSLLLGVGDALIILVGLLGFFFGGFGMPPIFGLVWIFYIC